MFKFGIIQGGISMTQVDNYKNIPVIDAFLTREDLKKFDNKGNALILYALQLKYKLEDLDSVAADSLIDGPNDKKCDLVYIDRDSGEVVIAQGYYSDNPSRKEAKANKASDLNTAIGWLITRDISEVPSNIQSAAEALREAIKSKEVRSIKIWFVHNLEESQNVLEELKTVENTAKHVISSKYPNIEIEIEASEIGRNTLEEWYEDLEYKILVTDSFKIEVPGGYSINGEEWSAFVTTVPAKWLHSLYQKYKEKLFSANVRDFLGVRNSDRNINFGIKNTAEKNPDNFWVYNNGITALVNNIEILGDEDEKVKLKIDGLSIVNGAQTTGAIGTLSSPPSEKARVPIRFVMCNNASTVEDIIKYNNTQNKIEASDFRSNDSIQQRLRSEFRTKFPNIKYYGARRGHNIIRRTPPDLIPSESAAQALVAFHIDPIIAYHEKTKIWIDNKLYSKVFNENTSAEHIVFVYSLLKSIERIKIDLVNKKDSEGDEENKNKLSDAESNYLTFLRNRGAKFLLLTAIAECLETIIGEKIPNRFRLGFKKVEYLDEAINSWLPIVRSVLPFHRQLSEALKDGLKSKENVKRSITNFCSMVESICYATQDLHSFKEFRGKIVY